MKNNRFYNMGKFMAMESNYEDSDVVVFGVGFDGEAFAFFGFFHGFEVHADFFQGEGQCAGGGSGDDDFVAHMQFAGFHLKFRHTQFREIANAFGGIHLHAGGAGSVFAGPFAEALP